MSGNDWTKTGKKVGLQLLYIFIAGLASVYGGSPYYLMIAPLLTGLVDYWKHKNG